MSEGLEGVILISDVRKEEDYQKSLKLAGLEKFFQVIPVNGEGVLEVCRKAKAKAEFLVFSDGIIDGIGTRAEANMFLQKIHEEFPDKEIIFFTHWDDTDPEKHAELILIGRGEDSVEEKCQVLAKKIKEIFH